MYYVFEPESFDLVAKPVECAMNCAPYDMAHNSSHRHCATVLDAKTDLRCNALVYVEQEGPSRNEIAVLPEHGCICSECKDVTCKGCSRNSPLTDKPVCDNCYDEARKEIEEQIAMDDSLNDALSGLNRYRDLLKTEKNPIKIKETVKELTQINDVYEEIMRILPENIARAYSSQQASTVSA